MPTTTLLVHDAITSHLDTSVISDSKPNPVPFQTVNEAPIILQKTNLALFLPD